MRVDYVTKAVAEISAHREDVKIAQGLEMELFIEVLTSIAEGKNIENAQLLAAEALKSRAIKFTRL